ncbi:MAG: phosphatase PAP2 family protein [Mailhella sp.]|nr:phosphatase PAP2 family protein [Mailhella sp.]
MFSYIEDVIFEFFNMYLRNSIFDVVLPLFESSLPVFLVTLVFSVVFAVYCKKKYGEMIYRVLLFMGMLGLSAFFAHEGSHFFAFERPRPFQEVAGTMYYDSKDGTWLQAQYPSSEGYHIFESDTAPESDEMSGETAVSENQAENREKISESGKVIENPLHVDLKQLHIKLIDGSKKLFPSSVISISMAVAVVIALLMAKISPYIYLFPLFIGWSQIYTGSAYLSDLLVGWCVGIVAVFAAWLCFALFFRITGKYF